jgi:hypothetical protein
MRSLLCACYWLCLGVSPTLAQDVPPSRDAVLLTISKYAEELRGDYFYPRGLVADQI